MKKTKQKKNCLKRKRIQQINNNKNFCFLHLVWYNRLNFSLQSAVKNRQQWNFFFFRFPKKKIRTEYSQQQQQMKTESNRKKSVRKKYRLYRKYYIEKNSYFFGEFFQLLLLCFVGYYDENCKKQQTRITTTNLHCFILWLDFYWRILSKFQHYDTQQKTTTLFWCFFLKLFSKKRMKTMDR